VCRATILPNTGATVAMPRTTRAEGPPTRFSHRKASTGTEFLRSRRRTGTLIAPRDHVGRGARRTDEGGCDEGR
jgi:hypothetical protein